MIDRIVIGTIDAFLRENNGAFSLPALNRFLRPLVTEDVRYEVSTYVKSHPLVFQINEKAFVSRASIFTNALFSIKPTKAEIAQGILIPGHRCMPFVDPDIYPHEILFSYDNITVPQKIIETPLADVMDASYLYGEEYIPQLFASDPANEELDIAKNDYAIPNIINLSVLDMSEIYAKLNFKFGDRILASVKNWDSSIVELVAQKSTKETPFEITEEDELRSTWFTNLDESLRKTISKYGPLSSIEEQLAYTFSSHKELLCGEFSSSIEEYMNKKMSISIEYYGVESRLWIKDEEIPAIGVWNEGSKDNEDLINTLYDEIGIPIPYYMLDAYIFDSLYRQEKNIMGIYDRIIPDKAALPAKKVSSFLIHVQERFDKLKKKYNRFIDFEKGEIRSRSLDLYSQLVKLICELDTCGLSVESLPQQQLVIVSQLFSHTTKFLEAFMADAQLSKDDIEMISSSLDGMVESYEDISTDLRQSMVHKKRDGFSIV